MRAIKDFLPAMPGRLLVLCALAATSQARPADAVRPLRVIQVDIAETWIGVRPGEQGSTWLILHRHGLKKVDVASGEVVDVLNSERNKVLSGSSRGIAPNGELFAYSADGKNLTLARVDDGSTVVRANATRLIGDRETWPADTFLSKDGTHMYCIDHQNGQWLLLHAQLAPEPRIVGSYDLGRFAHTMKVGRGRSAPIVLTTTDGSRRAPRFLQAFDQELRLQHKQKIGETWLVESVITHPEDNQPRALLAYTHHRIAHNRWLLVYPREGKWVTICSGIHPPQRGYGGIAAAAISPDGRWIVTAPNSSQTVLGVWSVPDGALRREVCLEGGVYDVPELPGRRDIRHVEFSKSGEYLTASDLENAYLLRFRDLIEAPSSR